MTAKIILRPHALEALPELDGASVTDIAKRIGVTRQTVARAIEGEPVSAPFIAAVTIEFGMPFDHMFKAVREPIAA